MTQHANVSSALTRGPAKVALYTKIYACFTFVLDSRQKVNVLFKKNSSTFDFELREKVDTFSYFAITVNN